MNIWMDKAYSKAYISNDSFPESEYLEKNIIDVYKYEALLNGVDFDKSTCTAHGFRWIQENEVARKKLLPKDFNKHVTFDEFMTLDSNLDNYLSTVSALAVQTLLNTTPSQSRKVVKSSRLPKDWETWEQERKVVYGHEMPSRPMSFDQSGCPWRLAGAGGPCADRMTE
ncbi:unnamed protein product [Hymenolepis diminuta]|uniref:Peptidase_M13_N domain-containing protein n=1 Tax=Hymenolepis diminuta TaxID=6216 RepID=A0A0R3SZB8_HYMDI|nr:unnamed protein product [Hymenolepis diminuta]